MIVACMSTYREGRLVLEAVRSALKGCDHVIVLEGYAGDGADPEPGEPTPLDELELLADGLELADDGPRLHLHPERGHASDADKRTRLLELARRLRHRRDMEPLWVLWLDGDEVLMWPEMLADHCHRFDLEQTATGGFPLRLVELDGSTVLCYGKMIRGDRVKRYLHSSYQVELEAPDGPRDRPGPIVALPNVPLTGAGGIPVQVDPKPRNEDEQAVWLARYRQPLQGEPHLLHRSALRHPDRAGTRMHDAEAEWFPERLAEHGLEGVE